jgi:hypothetical protein
MLSKRAETVGRVASETFRVLGKHGQEQIVRAKGYVEEQISEYKRGREPLSEDNWHGKAARSCEGVSDSILRDKNGTSARIVKGIAGKLGYTGATAGIFLAASLLGTAGTGTAIGSLSGAAFTSAALAWIGGSVVLGSIIVGFASLAGGIGAVLGASWVSKKYLFGKKRHKTELDERERKIVDVCLSLALAFREQERKGEAIDPISAKALYHDALKPLCDELLEYEHSVESWPTLAQRKLHGAIQKLEGVTRYLLQWSRRHPNASAGVVSALLIQLLADDIPEFNENEQLVLEALRRSKTSLENATEEELAAYIQAMEPNQISGLHNSIKGKYHELRFKSEENADGDEYSVELFEATNHPGADVMITNSITGDVKTFQLKATNYLSYVREHNEKYGSIPVLGTEEIADQDSSIESTGMRNQELNGDVSEVFGGLDAAQDPSVMSSMAVAGMVTLARNAKVLLQGKRMAQEEKEELVRGGVISAGVAGLAHLLIG